MSPTRTWSSEWQSPEAARRIWTSPATGSPTSISSTFQSSLTPHSTAPFVFTAVLLECPCDTGHTTDHGFRCCAWSGRSVQNAHLRVEPMTLCCASGVGPTPGLAAGPRQTHPVPLGLRESSGLCEDFGSGRKLQRRTAANRAGAVLDVVD